MTDFLLNDELEIILNKDEAKKPGNWKKVDQLIADIKHKPDMNNLLAMYNLSIGQKVLFEEYIWKILSAKLADAHNDQSVRVDICRPVESGTKMKMLQDVVARRVSSYDE